MSKTDAKVSGNLPAAQAAAECDTNCFSADLRGWFLCQDVSPAWQNTKSKKQNNCVIGPQGSGTGSVLDPHEGFILVLIEADKDITRVEIGKHLADTCGLRVVPATIWYWLDRRAITFKQNRARQRAAAPRGAAQARGDRNGGCRTPLPAAL